MKKGVIIGIAVLAVSIIGLLIFSLDKNEISDQNRENKEIEKTGEATQEEIPVENESKQEVEKDEAFQIFNPILTYPGAYNGPLYATSEQIGSAPMDLYFDNLDRNGINFFIGMFSIFGNPATDTLISNQGLGRIIDSAQKHPRRVIPFFNPGIGGEDVDQYLGTTLTKWYADSLSASQQVAGKDFIRGFGEVETQEWQIRHNDAKVIQLIDIAQSNDINFMFHPVASKIDDVEKIAKAYPDTIFLIHMYREDLANSKSKLIKILQENNNIYFSMDAAHILFVDERDIIYEYDSINKQSSIKKFVATVDSEEQLIIDDAIKSYKPLIDAAPDKIMWGTEIGPEYAFDPEVFDRAIKISRFVIAGFDEEQQEAVGYKNALRVFGEGIVADTSIKVIDTRSWPECSDEQVGECEDKCEEGGQIVENSPEVEDCYVRCTIAHSCIEIPEMDVG